MRVIDNLDAGFAVAPDRAVLVDAQTGEARTYAETVSFTHRFAHAVRAKGLTSDSKIAVLAHNGVLMYETVLGILRSDAIWLPISSRAGQGELVDILAKCECDVIFYEEEAATVIHALTARLKRVEAVPLTRDAIDAWVGDLPTEAFLPAPDLEAQDEDGIYAIQATGGTTGDPKAVLFSHRNARYIVTTLDAVCPFVLTRRNPYPVYLATAPFTHAGGQVMQLIMRSGGTAVTVHSARPTDLLAMIEKFRVTHTFLPPTVVYGMLDAPTLQDHDYSSLQYLIYGASPMSAEKLVQAVEAFGPVLAQCYGQTETGMPNLWLAPQQHFAGENLINGVAPLDRLTAAGRITPGTDLVILDDEKRAVAPGVRGEIAVRGDGVTPGYFKDAEATAEARYGDYHLTGDVAFTDDEGYVHIVDRKKDMIITGGFNVYSAEVERRILAFPGVSECAVFGVPDEKWGEAVTAVVEPTPGVSINLDELQRFCRAELGAVKTPKTIILREELPRSTVGKVLKRELRREYWGNQQRMVS